MDEKIVKDSQGLAKELVNDCISRQGVSAWLANRGYRGLANKVMDEDRFPSVQLKSYRSYREGYQAGFNEGYQAGFKDAQPERERGKWDTFFSDSYKVHKIGVECSCCGYRTQERTNYCPRCGADMRGEENG